MESDICSISGLFGACIEEEAEKGGHKFDFIRQASVRFFRSIKQAHRNISGSLSSVLSRQSTETETSCSSEKSNNAGKNRRLRSIAFGEEFKAFSIPASIGKMFCLSIRFTLKHIILFSCLILFSLFWMWYSF